LLRKLLWELEGSLWRHATHGRLQRIECSARTERLSRRYHAHVDVLLVRRLDLLLLLLQQFDLLLDSKLFH
jgi:hypothetical protein